MPSTISKPRRTEDKDGVKPTKTAAEPRAAPSFVSTLKAEETDFPRGGGTSLTALEVKQTRDEGRREAEAEDRADVGSLFGIVESELIYQSSKSAKKRKPQISERHAKRLKKNVVSGGKTEDQDTIREHERKFE
jgi:rRNA biogenesis protein RRP5